jgi:signal transduction histidine kinase
LTGFGKRHAIAVELLHEGMEQRLVPEVETTVYRIVQEAMTNVAKHAGAAIAFVYLQRTRGVLRVVMEDDGVGFDPASAKRGLGMIGIRERVAHLQGTVILHSAPGRGTRLTIELPALCRAVSADAADFGAPDTVHVAITPEVLLG